MSILPLTKLLCDRFGASNFIDDENRLLLNLLMRHDFVLVDPMEKPGVNIVDLFHRILLHLMLETAHGEQPKEPVL